MNGMFTSTGAHIGLALGPNPLRTQLDAVEKLFAAWAAPMDNVHAAIAALGDQTGARAAAETALKAFGAPWLAALERAGRVS
jgi:hypothetical protein